MASKCCLLPTYKKVKHSDSALQRNSVSQPVGDYWFLFVTIVAVLTLLIKRHMD